MDMEKRNSRYPQKPRMASEEVLAALTVLRNQNRDCGESDEES